MNESNKNILVVFIFGALITTYFLTIGIKPIIPNSVFNPPQSVKIDTLMPDQHSASTIPDPSPSSANECYASANQTVVEWKSMYWYPCQLSRHGICIWPPFRRRHITYKVTVKDGIPVRDENGNPIAIANGKIRAWEVYDSSAWNQIADFPRQLARYPDYEPIASNEYVVMVETRYRLFNNVESTLRLCTEQP
jgi:hypothetical protein